MSSLRVKFSEFVERGNDSVRAESLAITVRNIQAALKIVGELTEDPGEKKASRKPKDHLQALFLEQPKQGCFSLSMGFSPSSDSLEKARHEAVLGSFVSFLSSIEGRDFGGFIEKFESNPKTEELLANMIGIARLCTREFKIALELENGKEFRFYENRESINYAKDIIASGKMGKSWQEARDCVIADLKFIDLENLVLNLEYSASKTPLKFEYERADFSIRKAIAKTLEFQGNFIELHGDIEFGEKGVPLEIKKLSKIVEVNLDEVVVDRVNTKHGFIKPDRPLIFQPELDETKTVFTVGIEPFGTILYEQNRDFLVEEIHDHFSFLWDFYAMRDDEKLDAAAQQLKQTLLSNFNLEGTQ